MDKFNIKDYEIIKSEPVYNNHTRSFFVFSITFIFVGMQFSLNFAYVFGLGQQVPAGDMFLICSILSCIYGVLYIFGFGTILNLLSKILVKKSNFGDIIYIINKSNLPFIILLPLWIAKYYLYKSTTGDGFDLFWRVIVVDNWFLMFSGIPYL